MTPPDWAAWNLEALATADAGLLHLVAELRALKPDRGTVDNSGHRPRAAADGIYLSYR